MVKRRDEKSVYVFVYGTLKRGGKLHNIIRTRGAEFVGNGALADYDMYVVPGAWYPGIQMGQKGCGFVHGEVFKVSESLLGNLDVAEGVPELYIRHTKMILMGEITLDCEVYVYNQSLTGATLIINGDWDVKR